MEQISTIIFLIAIILIVFEGWLLSATYQVAMSKHRIVWVWLLNSLLGGMGAFVILSLSKELECDEELEVRKEPDLLGTTMAMGNITLIFILIILYYLLFSTTLRYYW